jgi:regulator of protease activity HflC (stomatin/prohibitin superfamily)
MTKVHREFFDNGNIKKELYYDSETTIVSEMKRYDIHGTLLLRMGGDGTVHLEDMLKKIELTSEDASYVDEDALQEEQSREAVERAREARMAEQRRIDEQRRAAAEAEARLKAAERFIGRTLGDNDLA